MASHSRTCRPSRPEIASSSRRPPDTFTYELDTGGDDLTVNFDQTWVVDPLPTNPDEGGPQPAQEPGQRLITLTTCAELFHTDERLVAFGHLVSSTPRSR